MRRVLAWLVTTLAVVSATPVGAQQAQLAALSWLAGCWSSESGEAGSGEHWMPLAGGSMLGVGRTVKNGKTVEHEFMRIQTNPEGTVVYIALPSGQQEATFTLLNLSEDAVTFENLQHEFPQRVMYHLLPGGRMSARIEGLRGGVRRGIDFPMKRDSCESIAKGAPAK